MLRYLSYFYENMWSTSGLLTLDYSDLNKSIQPKRKSEIITDETSKSLWEILWSVFVEKGKNHQKRIDALADWLQSWSESMKLKLTFTIDYLFGKKLLDSELIKSLAPHEIKRVLWEKKEKNQFLSENDQKIQNLIDYLIGEWRKKWNKLSEAQIGELEMAVRQKLDEHYEKLAKRDDDGADYEMKNKELENQLKASEKADEVVESALLERRYRNIVGWGKIWRVAQSIQKIAKDTSLKPEDRDRKILWQVNRSAVSGRWKRFDWINKLPSKVDANVEYNNAIDNLTNKMKDPKTKAYQKVLIRWMARTVNRAYTDYLERTIPSEEERREKMMHINELMAAA